MRRPAQPDLPVHHWRTWRGGDNLGIRWRAALAVAPSPWEVRLARCLVGATAASLVVALAALRADATVVPPWLPQIASLGPWPPPPPDDASNRVFADTAAADFGRRMFHDSRLSANGYVACATCHQNDRAWTDANAHAQGLAPVPRNTPTLDNVAWQRRFGWTGASDSLWMANLRPMFDPREMGATAARVAEVVRIGIGLPCRYREAFGRDPARVDDETLMVDVAKAIAAFERTLASGRTPFDDYRDALLAGDAQAMRRYPAAARRGVQLFVGKAGCASCHAGATFSDGSFHADDRGAAGQAPRREAGRGAARELLASRFNLAGAYNDAPARTRERIDALGVLAEAVGADAASSERYRVPGLRNVAVTAPYLHDGSVATLREAVRHREHAVGLEAGAGAASRLSDTEIDDLVAFLRTLTDAAGAARPRQWPGMPTECP